MPRSLPNREAVMRPRLHSDLLVQHILNSGEVDGGVVGEGGYDGLVGDSSYADEGDVVVAGEIIIEQLLKEGGERGERGVGLSVAGRGR